jgi:hypothetical protein
LPISLLLLLLLDRATCSSGALRRRKDQHHKTKWCLSREIDHCGSCFTLLPQVPSGASDFDWLLMKSHSVLVYVRFSEIYSPVRVLLDGDRNDGHALSYSPSHRLISAN